MGPRAKRPPPPSRAARARAVAHRGRKTGTVNLRGAPRPCPSQPRQPTQPDASRTDRPQPRNRPHVKREPDDTQPDTDNTQTHTRTRLTSAAPKRTQAKPDHTPG